MNYGLNGLSGLSGLSGPSGLGDYIRKRKEGKRIDQMEKVCDQT